ncbi:MAG: hypothetical protein C0483_06615 [Pirellula sp.]|nr:hypothetical protein [Pirellula sp.]
MQSEPPSDNLDELAAIGSDDWRVRRRAVGTLVGRPLAADELRQVLDVLRDSHQDFSRLNAAIQVLVQTGADVVPPLIDLLAHGDADVRCYVALALGERGDPRAAPSLVQALSDADPNVVLHAADALGRLRAAVAVDALLGLAESSSFAISFSALAALTAIGDERVWRRLPPLLQAPFLQIPATEALGALGDRDAVPHLTQLIISRQVSACVVAGALLDIYEREEARFAAGAEVVELIRRELGASGRQALLASFSEASFPQLNSLIQLVGVLRMAEAAPQLASLLHRPDVRVATLDALAKLGPAATSALLQELPQLDGETQCAVCELLGRLGGSDVVRALEGLLDMDEEDVVVAAANALANAGDAQIIPSLVALLDRRHKAIRHAASVAIATLDAPQAILAALPLLPHSSAHVREAAVKILGRCDAVGHLEQLKNACSDSDEQVRRAAIEMLADCRDESVLAIVVHALQTDRPRVRAAAVSTLANSDFFAARTWIAAALDDADGWVRYVALRELLQHEPATATTEMLVRLSQQPEDVPVRVTAIAALGARGAEFGVLASLVDDSEPDIAAAAIAAIGAGHFVESPPFLANLLADADPRRRFSAVQALAAAAPDALELLRHAAFDADRSVSAGVIAALARLDTPESIAVLLEFAAHTDLRELCLAELSRLDESAVKHVAQVLHDAELDVRRTAVEALTRRATSSAWEALSTVVDDNQPAVRYAARYAIARLSVSGGAVDAAGPNRGGT